MSKTDRLCLMLYLLLLVILTAFVCPHEAFASGASQAATLTPSEKQWLADHPKIRVAPDPDFPPIESFDDSGRYQGIAADYLALIEERLGVEFEILHPKTWDEALELAKSRRADVLAAAMKSPQRTEYMRFTDAHIRLPGVILARAGTRESLSLSDLVGLKVAVVSGYVWQDLITNDYPGINLQLVPDIRTGLKKVSFGMVDAMVGDPATTTHYIEQDGITNLRIAGQSGYTYELAIASRKDWPELNSILNKALASISHEEKSAIIHRWVRLDNADPSLIRKLWSFLLAGAAIVAVILFGAYLWNRSLRRQVEDRTQQLNIELAQRARAEQELTQLNETLDRRVQERTTQLESLNTSLQQEVADRKHAEAMQADLGRVLESSLNEIYIFDAETLRFIEVNRGARENLGYSMKELRMMTPFDLKREYTFESFTELVKPLRTGDKQKLVFTGEHLCKDGSKYPVEVHLQLNRLGSFPVFVAIVLDITARLESEAKLKAAMASAEAASRSKSEFLANMSHELRTPMTAILGYADLLRDPDQTPEQREDNIHTIHRNGEHLLTIINDILDLSKIEADKIEIERIACSPTALVAEVASLMRDRATQKGLAFLVDYDGAIPSSIVTDSTRLRQILVNLISNAIKFTHTGQVRVTLSMADPTDQATPKLNFRVTDTGIGMTPEQAKKLFQPFAQADTSITRKFGGTGLGLVISRRLAGLLGGDLTVQSSDDHGSTFSCTVDTGPLEGVEFIKGGDLTPDQPEPAKATPSGQGDKAQRLAGFRILLAEDGPDNQRLISFVLRKQGAEVEVAENGRIACEKVHAAIESGSPYQVILMDMQMPEMDGYTASRCLRSEGYKNPIIALTAHAMSGDRDKCLEAGCDEYLTKPLNKQKLVDTIIQLSSSELTVTSDT